MNRNGRLRLGAPRRGGMTMLFVVVALALTCAMTLAFLSSQTTSIRLVSNDRSADWSAQAARTGLQVGLEKLQSPSWTGAAQVITGTIRQDAEGAATYRVVYETPTTPTRSANEAMTGWQLRIVSTGTWTPAGGQGAVEHTLATVAQLTPRLAGRVLLPGESSSVVDLPENPANFDSAAGYTVFLTRGSANSNLPPNSRLEGPMWAAGNKISLFRQVAWSSAIRRDFLRDLKAYHPPSSSGPYDACHPLPGPIKSGTTAGSSLATDLGDIGTASWTRVSPAVNPPVLSPSGWNAYRLYDKGPVFQGQQVPSTLSQVTLRPTAANPLGIFYLDDNLTVGNDVSIVGTLAVTGTVTFTGKRIHVASYNWYSPGDRPFPGAGAAMPRLPVLLAKRLVFGATTQAQLEGLVWVQQDTSGTCPDWAPMNGLTDAPVAVRGAVTPLAQPYSRVTLTSTPSLGATQDGRYSLWVPEGASGRWLPITGWNSATRELTVRGEAAPVPDGMFTIAPTRASYFEICGQLTTAFIDVADNSDWGDLTSNNWSTIDWYLGLYKYLVEEGGDDPDNVKYPWYVSSPARLTYLMGNRPLYGLRLDPTFAVRTPAAGSGLMRLRGGLPLVAAYESGSAAENGYRWRIVSPAEAQP